MRRKATFQEWTEFCDAAMITPDSPFFTDPAWPAYVLAERYKRFTGKTVTPEYVAWLMDYESPSADGIIVATIPLRELES